MTYQMRLSMWSAVIALQLVARSGTCQTPGGPNLATRPELQDTLARLEGDRGAATRVALVRERLERGDFRVGDRICVRVLGEPVLSDTFTVAAGPELPLPQVGAVPLDGVLRSELPERVTTYLARYLREPVVQVRPLIRLMVEGDVARPGYYALSPDLPLADALAAAGGLTQHANVDEIRVQRGAIEILGGPHLQQALGRGSSIDQLNLQAGDRLLVPGHGPSAFQIAAFLLVTIPTAIYYITIIH